MEKLTLDLIKLRVESFEPLPRQSEDRGTVHAHGDTCVGQYSHCDLTRTRTGTLVETGVE